MLEIKKFKGLSGELLILINNLKAPRKKDF